MVRSGFIPGVDYAPAMQGPQTDAELLTEALGDFAEVTPQGRWSGVLDRRWMAINTNDDAASRPHLVDRTTWRFLGGAFRASLCGAF